MGLTLSLCASGFVGLLLSSSVGDDWGDVWAQAQASYSSQAGGDELAALIADKAPCLERHVAIFLVASLDGGSPDFVHCDKVPALSDASSWAFSIALEPGEALNHALVASLSDCPEGLVAPVLQRGYGEFMRASRESEADVAVELAEALHARAGAVWSAQNLAIAYTRQGAYKAGAECLLAALAGSMSPADRTMLQSRLSLVYWGEGGLLATRASLGASLCQGNSDSGIILGLSSLERGRFDRARSLFRSVLGHDPSQPWARKGWGLSMLPY